MLRKISLKCTQRCLQGCTELYTSLQNLSMVNELTESAISIQSVSRVTQIIICIFRLFKVLTDFPIPYEILEYNSYYLVVVLVN